MQQENMEKLEKLKQQLAMEGLTVGEADNPRQAGDPQHADDPQQAAQPVPQKKICELASGDGFSGVLLVRSADIRTGKTGRAYMDLRLGDASGELVAKLWNVPDGMKALPGGVAASVAGKVESYNGQLQLRADYVREAADISAEEKMRLVPSAPQKPEVMRR